MKLLLSLFIVSALHCNAQQLFFIKQWDNRYGSVDGDGLRSLAETSDGGFILGGGSFSGISGDKTQPNWDTSQTSEDFWIVKTDSLGNKEWDKRYGGTDQEHLLKALQTSDGGYILGGETKSGNNGDITQSSRGGWDFWIVKTDALGNKEWDRRFGGSRSDGLVDLTQTADSGYILGGISNSPISGDKTEDDWDPSGFYRDFWVVKTNSLGHKEWDKRLGGIGDDAGHAVVQTDDGGYLVGGYSASDSSGDKTQNTWGFGDYWVVKIDSSGNKVWDKRFGGINGESFRTLTKIQYGAYVLGGNSHSGVSGDKTQPNWSTNYDYWIVKIDSVGTMLWDKDFGAVGDEELSDLTTTNDGGYLLCGSSQSSGAGGDKTKPNLGFMQTWVVKTDSMGNKQWDKTVLTTDASYYGFATQTKDGCYLFGNYTTSGIGGDKSQVNRGGADYWIVKFCMDTVTGIDDGGQMADDGWVIQVYPNPFVNDISISLQKENLHEATFTITNLMGQTIYHKQETNLANSYTKMLDLSYLPGGVYLLQVIVEGERMVRQIVKE